MTIVPTLGGSSAATGLSTASATASPVGDFVLGILDGPADVFHSRPGRLRG
jgi:hypothetical protein